MPALTACRECGAEVWSGTPFGHCPKCLIKLGFITETPPPALEANSDRRIGDYELREQIGRGGMGAVYRAWKISLKCEVALKMILPADTTRPEAIKRFQIEAEASAQLQHPNIVRIYEIGRDGAHRYIAMQLVEGTNLKERLSEFQLPDADSIRRRSDARAAQEKIARLMSKVAAAVHYAHERNVLHRDLKPQNILISDTGEPFLTDFGIAKILNAEDTVTETTSVVGTPHYMAPEQAAGKPVSASADVFSLGAILYELLTHAPPFKCATPAETFRQLAEQEPVPPQLANQWIDPDLAVICLKCLQKNLRERYATAGELEEDLGRWIRNEPIRARPVSSAVRVQRWIRRNRAVTALLGALGLGLVTALCFLQVALQQMRGKVHVTKALAGTVSDWLGSVSAPRNYIEITSEAMAPWVGKEPDPVRGPHERLSLGVLVHQNALGTLLKYSVLADYLEKAMAKELHRPVRFNLRLYEEMPPDALAADHTDFVRVSSLFYVEARSRGQALQPVVRPVNSTLPCMIVARADSGMQKLSELRGHSLIFGEECSPVTFLAKAHLVQNGIRAPDLSACAYIQSERSEFTQGGYSSVNSSVLEQLSKRNYDAGVILERQFVHSQFSTNFVPLARFDYMDSLWVAASTAPAAVVSAFQRAMQDLRDPRVLMNLPDNPVSPTGFVPALTTDYEEMEKARAIAVEFDAPISAPEKPNIPFEVSHEH